MPIPVRSTFGFLACTILTGFLAAQPVASAGGGAIATPLGTRPASRPTTAPADEAVRFESADHRFRLRHPPTWKQQDIGQKIVALMLLPAGSSPDDATIRPQIMVMAFGEPADPGSPMQLERAFERYVQGLKRQMADAKILESGDATLGSVAAKRVVTAGTAGKTSLRFVTVLAINDNKLYTLTAVAKAEQFDATQADFEKVVKSFEWVKKD